MLAVYDIFTSFLAAFLLFLVSEGPINNIVRELKREIYKYVYNFFLVGGGAHSKTLETFSTQLMRGSSKVLCR